MHHVKRISSLPASDDVLRVQLPNGIVVLARSNFNSPSVIIKGFLQVGSLYDPDPKLGLSSFVASALMRGTQNRSYDRIFDTLESVGAKLGFGANTHTGSFSGKALVEDLDLLLEIFSESLREPVFPIDECERLRAQILTGLALRTQSTEAMASLKFDEVVYKDHPYGRDGDGKPETIAAITRKDLVRFHETQFGPSGMVIVLVGGVDPKAAVEKINRFLGDWENPNQQISSSLPIVQPLEETVEAFIPIPDKSQVDFLVGMAGPARSHPGFIAASLGNNVFGQFGMYGRIGHAVRERSGLAYYAYSSLGGGIGPGPWFVSAGVDPVNLEAAVDLIRKEIIRLVNDGVSEDELEDSKAHYIGSLPLSLESNAGVAAAILNIERYDLGLDYYLGYADRIRGITTDAVLNVVREYWDPDKLAIISAGPLGGGVG